MRQLLEAKLDALNTYQDSSQWAVQSIPPRERPCMALFNGIPDDDVTVMLSRAAVDDFPARSWIFHQGEPAREFFLLLTGLVRLGQLTEQGDEILVRFVAPGEVFGYLALVPGERYAVMAHVIQPGRLVTWNQTTMLQLLHTYPKMAANLINIAMHEVVLSYDRTRRQVADPVRRRVLWALAELIRTIGVRIPHEMIVLDIGQRELAKLAGTTIYTVSRTLSSLENEELLKTGRDRIMLLQPEKILEESSEIKSVVATLGSLALNY
jgi:CRP-like cAMP-binding protein